jgi:hypothetical protein
LPVSGSRTWQWATAAPALAASMAALAICSGVIGMAGCLPTVSPDPVTAQAMMTSEFMSFLLNLPVALLAHRERRILVEVVFTCFCFSD